MLLEAYDLADCVKEDFYGIDKPSAEQIKNEKMACLAIRIALPIDVSRELNSEMSACELWRTVKAFYTREEEASKDSELDRFLSYRMQPHQEMADYLSKRKIGWNKLKAFLPDLDECIYRYALFSGLQDLPEDLYKDTINIIKYSANVTKTEMSVHHISGVLMQRAMEIHGTKEKELSTDRALQAKTPDRFQHASRTNMNYRPRNQQRSQSYTIGGKQNKPVKCFECGSIEHVICKCPFVTCSNCGAKGHMAGACRNSANQVEDIRDLA